MKVTMSGDVQEMAATRIAAIRRYPSDVLAICEAAAAELRATDSYQDRTGDLRESTQAIAAIGGSVNAVTLQMGEAYASFVKRLGFSRWDEVSARAAVQVRQSAKAAIGEGG